MGFATLEGDAMKSTVHIIAALIVLVTFSDTRTDGQDSSGDLSPVDHRPDVVLVVGAGGEPQYQDVFAGWAMRWHNVAQTAGANVTRIGMEDAIGEGATGETMTDLDQLRLTLEGLPQKSRQAVWLVMIGHGTSGKGGTKFNLRGPDVSVDQLAGWLKPIDRPIVVVGAFSSSAPLINAISGPNRVVVTATQSGQEQNFSRFGDYLSQAIGDQDSDIDHDGEVSILEAFLAASAATADYYRREDRLQTETALIDDNGDSLGTKASAFRGVRSIAKPASADRLLDGPFASTVTLSPPSAEMPLTEAEAIERDEIEADLRHLHTLQASMSEQQYRDQVLPKWIRLAKIYRAAELRNEAKPNTSEEDAKKPAGSPAATKAGEQKVKTEEAGKNEASQSE
jgi:hypothetical protein